MAINKVVCRYQSGRVIKGFTQDFSPGKEFFHIQPFDTPAEAIIVRIKELKAIFFVKDLEGSKEYEDKLFVANPVPGKDIVVEFSDGEIMAGITHGFRPGRDTFFITPVDPNSNNERIYVVIQAAKKVMFGADAERFLEELRQKQSKKASKKTAKKASKKAVKRPSKKKTKRISKNTAKKASRKSPKKTVKKSPKPES